MSYKLPSQLREFFEQAAEKTKSWEMCLSKVTLNNIHVHNMPDKRQHKEAKQRPKDPRSQLIEHTIRLSQPTTELTQLKPLRISHELKNISLQKNLEKSITPNYTDLIT